MKRSIKEVLFFGIIFLLVDQVIKVVLSNNMVLNQSNILIRNLFSITLVHNTGAAFSILTGSRYLLIAIGIIAVILILFYLKRVGITKDIEVFIFSLLIGGVLGNLVDRIIHGYVIDYLSFNVGSYYFPIFNFADVCIVISIAMLLFGSLREDLWK